MAQNNEIFGSLRALALFLCLFLATLPAVLQAAPVQTAPVQTVALRAAALPWHLDEPDSANAQRLTDPFGSTAISMLAIDLDSGDTLWSASPRQSLTPASSMKAITTGMGFLTLGSRFRFCTTVRFSGEIRGDTLHGNLVLTGGGDPAFGSTLFDEESEESIFGAIADMLHQHHVAYITGDLVADSRIFSDDPVHQAWNWEDIGNGYGAGVHGLNFNENKFVVTVSYRPDNGISVQWPQWFLQSGNRARIDRQPFRAGQSPSLIVFAAPHSAEFTLVARIPENSQSYEAEAAITRPGLLCMEKLGNHLRLAGTTYGGSVRMAGPLDSAVSQIAGQLCSPPYPALAKKINELSHNIMADAICKTIGLQTTGYGSFESGAWVMDSLLRAQLPNQQSFRILDGSGLARANALSASLFCDFLGLMYRSPWFDNYYNCLVGVDAPAFATFLSGVAPRTTLRLKSGSMSGVRCYTGYVRSMKGKMVAFAWMVNGYTGSATEAKKSAEVWLKRLIEMN